MIKTAVEARPSSIETSEEEAFELLNKVPYFSLREIKGANKFFHRYEILCLMEKISENYYFGDNLEDVAESVYDYRERVGCSDDSAIYMIVNHIRKERGVA